MPILPEGGPSARERGAAELPVGMKPVGITREDDDAVFLAGVVEGVVWRDAGARRRADAAERRGGGAAALPGFLRRAGLTAAGRGFFFFGDGDRDAASARIN